MANAEHLSILRNGVDFWNRWRESNPEIRPDLSSSALSRQDLRGLNLRGCSLAESHLNRTDLRGADLSRANLSRATLTGANMRSAVITEAVLDGANVSAADLAETDLSYASLIGSHLTDANLSHANLTGADLGRSNLHQANLAAAVLPAAKLHWANLSNAKLQGANLRRSDLTGANFIQADLTEADFTGANLRYSRIIESRVDRATFSNARVYGVSVWDVSACGAIESDLIITPPDEPTITVDNLEVAQFVYLLLNSAKVRQTIDTVTARLVLILGRFSQDRIKILENIRDALRQRSYLPMLFDFVAPSSRDLTETISTLAHLARFIIVDLTEARSVPQELMSIVPHLPSVPVQPLLAAGATEYALFDHFRRYPWVLEVVRYRDENALSSILGEQVIAPAEARSRRQL